MQGKNNIIDQRNKSGEYSNYPQEELLEFINKKMPKNAVFGGSMPTMATIKLVTKVGFSQSTAKVFGLGSCPSKDYHFLFSATNC